MNEIDIKNSIRLIDKRIKDLNELDPYTMANQVGNSRTEAKYISNRITSTIGKAFGFNSEEYIDHANERWIKVPNEVLDDSTNSKIGDIYKYAIKRSITILEQLKIDLNENLEDILEDPQEVINAQILQPAKNFTMVHPTPTSGADYVETTDNNEVILENDPSNRKVFVVHGRDEELKEKVARVLQQLKLDPIILHEQPNKGNTLIEKFLANSKVKYAVVLLTPDDVGSLKKDKIDTNNLRDRARQNVVLELGYFLGSLSRQNVCALYKGSVELPSDMQGIAYIPVKDDSWKLGLAKEIRAAGIEVDLNLL